MKTNNSRRKNKFLALCLSVLMLTSTAAAFASCAKDTTSSDSSSSSSDSTETTPKDTYIVTNAGFETFDDKDGENLIGTSVTGWTRSVNSETSGSALSSKAASGIVDTADDAWKNLTESKLGSVTIDDLVADESLAESKWESMSAKDKLEYYKAYEEETDEDADDLSFYESFNIDSDDLPASDMKNPGTHYAADDTKNKDKTNVLMIHNEYSNSTYNNFGTAQKFTSSSTVTLSAGTSATFSVWVKTSDLTSTDSAGNVQAAVDKGAYISVTNSVGSTSLDPLEIVNINTETMTGLEATNGWKQYSFVLHGASFADTTFTIVLGLGKGSSSSRGDFVNGYAFFDDIECKTMQTPETTADANAKLFDIEATKAEKSVKAANADKAVYGLDYSGAADSSDLPLILSIDDTKETIGSKDYTAESWINPGVTDFDTAYDVTEVLNASALNNRTALVGTETKPNNYAQIVYDKYFQNDQSTDMLLLLSASGAPYTAKSALPSFSFTLSKDEYLAVSFFVKTSNMSGYTGAGISLVDGTTKTSISSLDTTAITPVSVGEGDSLVEDIHNGWQQCFFFVTNETDNAIDFHFEFTFGPTSLKDSTASSYQPGFAAFKDFKSYSLDEKTYACATSGTYTQVISLVGDTDEAAGDAGFDVATGVPTNAIENGYAIPKNYKGVYSDNALVTGSGASDGINKNETAGLLNKEHEANYSDILHALALAENTHVPSGTPTAATWESVFGNETTQPLVIYNKDAQTKAYGYIGTTATFAADAYATLSLRVKTVGTTASVYLIDTDNEKRESSLTIGAKATYWYDADGNVCASDPSKSDFDEKTDVAFKLQPNGLYKVNADWEGAKDVDKDAYFANLSAYAETDDEQNKLVAEGGVSYNYTNKWLNDGNDGIAFYHKDGKYYADSNYKTAVSDLASVATLPRRTDKADKKALEFVNVNTNGEWATVTFYVHTGSTAKSYRLEVWSGNRAGSASDANSYVAFDANKPADVDATSFGNLVKERKDEVSKDDWFESVFSFYDTDKFLRYDETADKNNVGNSYKSYNSATYTQGVAYLKYAQSDAFELYADYAYSDTSVAADVEEEESTTPNETTPTGDTMNVWLLISSIAIAAVLLLAVASLLIRKVILRKRRSGATKPVVKVSKPKKEKKAKAKAEKEVKDENSPYND